MNKILKDDPIWCDVFKMWLAIRGDPGKFHTSEYIQEKLMQILKRECYWHFKVIESFDDNIDSLCARYNIKSWDRVTIY